MKAARYAWLALVLGCAPPAAEPAAPARAPEDVGAADAGAVDAGAPALPARMARCERCHEDAAAEHARSMHAQAFDDPLFQREWSHGRAAWCVRCHAPLAESADDPRAHEGVGCAACHVENGVITSAHASGRASHETRVIEDLASSERCGTCHDFAFPSRQTHPERMQRTLEEWRASGRSETCAECHMPTVSRGFRDGIDHAVRGPRDAALTAHAVAIDVSARRERGRVVVEARLRVDEAAHAVPTGDLYRRLVFTVRGPNGTHVEADMSRLFERGEDEGMHEIADQRVLPAVERVLRLALPSGARGDDVRWELVWHALPEGARDVDAIDLALRERTWARGRARVR